jgi:hypothetical protein
MALFATVDTAEGPPFPLIKVQPASMNTLVNSSVNSSVITKGRMFLFHDCYHWAIKKDGGTGCVWFDREPPFKFETIDSLEKER